MLCASACSSSHTRPHDAATEDAPAPHPDASLCGNQVLDPNEQCDQGLRNGTPQGRCTRQCLDGVYPNAAIQSATRLPGHKVNEPFRVQLNGDTHVVFRDNDAVYLALGLNDTTIGGSFTPMLLQLRGAAAPTSLGWFITGDTFTDVPRSYSFPLWIEQPSSQTSGIQGLYWAHLDTNNTPVIHSLPYPFPDGTGGVILTTFDRPAMIVDQSSTPPYDLLVAVVSANCQSGFRFTTARIPSHGMRRGVVAGNRLVLDSVEQSEVDPPPQVHRIVQFYEDTHAFSQIDVRPPTTGDLLGLYGQFSIYESATGTWPFDVAGAADWREAMADAPGGDYNALSHPNPFAVINTDGSVYIWQFNSSFPSEGFVAPFAQVSPGTHVAFTFYRADTTAVLWSLAPDGSVSILNDGDTEDLRSPSLESETLPAISPWANASISPNSQDEGAGLMGADDTIYLLWGA